MSKLLNGLVRPLLIKRNELLLFDILSSVQSRARKVTNLDILVLQTPAVRSQWEPRISFYH